MTNMPTQPNSTGDYRKPLASDLIFALGAIGGLFLMMIGSIVSGLSTNGSLVDDFGNIIASFGLFIISGLLFLMSIVRVELDKHLRIAMMLAATLLVIFVGFW